MRHLERKIIDAVFHDQGVNNILIIQDKDTLNVSTRFFDIAKQKNIHIHVANLATIHQEKNTIDFDLVISLMQLNQMDSKELYMRTMQNFAPQALFIDYINPERNIAYPAYFICRAGKCLAHYIHIFWNIFSRTQLAFSWKAYKRFMSNNGLEKVLYDLQTQKLYYGLSFHVQKRQTLCGGAIGLVLLKWHT